LERLPGGPDTLNRPRTSHRQQKPRRGALAAGAGVAATLAAVGVAVAVGAVPSPLSSNTPKVPDAATLAAAPASAVNSLLQASASPFGFATAKMPAKPAPHKPKPSHTPSKAATPTQQPATQQPTTQASQPSTDSGGLTPQPTAEYETPKGDNEKAWSEAILTSLGAPLTSANIVSIGYWMQNEAGGPGAGIVGANNPINVSQPCCGGVPIQDDGDGVTFLQSYPTVADGIDAITQYLNRGNYTAILADLKSGVGLMTDSNLASEISLYSGGGYSTIPDSWGQSQGTPES
jgi:hypothetical protein